MAGPIVIEVTSDRNKLSDEPGFTIANLTITFDEPVQAYTVNSLGVSYDTGTIVHSDNKNVSKLVNRTVSDVSGETILSIREFTGDVDAEVDYTELPSEGDNKISIYGQSQATKVWTS